MTTSEFLLIVVGIIQYFLFAFAQEAMMLGASRQDKLVDPTANIFGIRDVARDGIWSRTGALALAYVYVDFFKGFFSFFRFVFVGFIATFRDGAKDFFAEEKIFADEMDIGSSFERRTLNKLRFYIYLFNSFALIMLCIGIGFAIKQRGPETYIRPVDLFLIVFFNVFTILCLILAYEARVRILRGRYTIIIEKLLERRRTTSDQVDINNIVRRLSEVVGQIDADSKKTKSRDVIIDRQEEILPKSVEEKIRRLAENPGEAEKFLLDNKLIISDD